MALDLTASVVAFRRNVRPARVAPDGESALDESGPVPCREQPTSSSIRAATSPTHGGESLELYPWARLARRWRNAHWALGRHAHDFEPGSFLIMRFELVDRETPDRALIIYQNAA